MASGQQFRPPTMNNAPHASQSSAGRPVQNPPVRPETTIQHVFKQDVSKARELLTEMLNKAAQVLQENIKQPGSQRDSHRLRVEKSFEDLYTILDQIEANLKLGIQWYNQSLDSKKHVPVPITSKKTDEAQQKAVPLQQYMKVAKWQIQAAKELHDLLTDTENKLAQASVPPTPVSIVSSVPLPTSQPLQQSSLQSGLQSNVQTGMQPGR